MYIIVCVCVCITMYICTVYIPHLFITAVPSYPPQLSPRGSPAASSATSRCC